MRIAMLTETYLPTRDGVVTSILLTKRELEKRGHEVFILAPAPEDDADREEGVRYFRSTSFEHYPGYRVSCFPSDKVHVISELDVDLIHCHSLLFFALRSMFAGRALGKPVVVTFHTMITEAWEHYTDLPLDKDITERLFWIYLKSLLTRADAVIAPTDAIRRELLEHAPDMRLIETVPTGVDCDRFRPDIDGGAVRERYAIGDRPALLHLGRVAKEKGIDLVIESFARLDGDAVLMVVGSGPAREGLEALSSELGVADRVIFTGFVPDGELPEYYAACDAFVIASRFETQGLVVLEAMACGKPVIGVAHRAVAEIVEDGVNGYLFDDVDGCIEAMARALDPPVGMAGAARATAERYSLDGAIDSLEGLYHKAVGIKRRRLED